MTPTSGQDRDLDDLLDGAGTPAGLDASATGEGGPSTAQGTASPGRGLEGLDTTAAERGSPSRGEGQTDEELLAQVRDPDHRA